MEAPARRPTPRTPPWPPPPTSTPPPPSRPPSSTSTAGPDCLPSVYRRTHLHSWHPPPWPLVPFAAQHDCSHVVYRCTWTHSPHPPHSPGHSFPSQLNRNLCSECTSVPIHTQCTRTHSPHPPPWPGHSFPPSAELKAAVSHKPHTGPSHPLNVLAWHLAEEGAGVTTLLPSPLSFRERTAPELIM